MSKTIADITGTVSAEVDLAKERLMKDIASLIIMAWKDCNTHTLHKHMIELIKHPEFDIGYSEIPEILYRCGMHKEGVEGIYSKICKHFEVSRA